MLCLHEVHLAATWRRQRLRQRLALTIGPIAELDLCHALLDCFESVWSPFGVEISSFEPHRVVCLAELSRANRGGVEALGLPRSSSVTLQLDCHNHRFASPRRCVVGVLARKPRGLMGIDGS